MQTRFRLTPVVRFGFGVILTAMGFIGAVSIFTSRNLNEANEWVTRTWEIRANVQDIENLLLNAETGQRGYVITGQEEYLAPYNNAINDISEEFDELEDLFIFVENETQLERLAEVEALTEQKIDELARTISLKRANQEEALLNLIQSGEGREYSEQIKLILADMDEMEVDFLEQRIEASQNAEEISTLIIIGATLGAIALGLVILIFIARQVVRPINEVANAIASASTEIAATVEQQERTASQQATAVNQTTTTIEELGASSQQSAEQAEAASDGSQQVLTLVTGVKNNGTIGFDANTSLRDKVGQLADQILHLSEQTNQIGSISNLVGDLANQTNMLALNAAVEAARAGENGKGFAVVATEIRKLADQSRKSAEQISSRVSDVRNATNSTVLVTDESSKTVEKIVTAINDIAVNSQQISLTANQQAVAVQQVVEAMNTLNSSAQENASGISQIKAGIQQLQEAALNLKAVV